MLVGGRSFPWVLDDTSADGATRLGDLLTVDEVAQYLRIPKNTVYKMTRSGDLRAFKVGKHWRVPRVELGAWIARQLPEQEMQSK